MQLVGVIKTFLKNMRKESSQTYLEQIAELKQTNHNTPVVIC